MYLPAASADGCAGDFLVAGGEAGALMRALDWSASPPGDPARCRNR